MRVKYWCSRNLVIKSISTSFFLIQPSNMCTDIKMSKRFSDIFENFVKYFEKYFQMQIFQISKFPCTASYHASLQCLKNKCSKSTIETLEQDLKQFKENKKDSERRSLRRSGVFTVNFQHISYLTVVFLLLILSR